MHGIDLIHPSSSRIRRTRVSTPPNRTHQLHDNAGPRQPLRAQYPPPINLRFPSLGSLFSLGGSGEGEGRRDEIGMYRHAGCTVHTSGVGVWPSMPEQVMQGTRYSVGYCFLFGCVPAVNPIASTPYPQTRKRRRRSWNRQGICTSSAVPGGRSAILLVMAVRVVATMGVGVSRCCGGHRCIRSHPFRSPQVMLGRPPTVGGGGVGDGNAKGKGKREKGEGNGQSEKENGKSGWRSGGIVPACPCCLKPSTPVCRNYRHCGKLPPRPPARSVAPSPSFFFFFVSFSLSHSLILSSSPCFRLMKREGFLDSGSRISEG